MRTCVVRNTAWATSPLTQTLMVPGMEGKIVQNARFLYRRDVGQPKVLRQRGLSPVMGRRQPKSSCLSEDKSEMMMF
jgi:hypothetical protein